jgi:ectoine hydroxylase-related dioxygenase (phytanoyl-CoA dioxygenase family)
MFLMLPEVLEVLKCYLGRSWFYQAMIATRTLAVEWVGKGFDYWHHDARGRKLNIFLLLTEVPPDGAATVVLAGSHRLLYDRSRLIKNSFTDQEVELLQDKFGWKAVVCSAPAGSLVFFNSHALHRGRRAPSARDAFQVNCMTKRSHLWPQEVNREIFVSLDSRHQSILKKHSNISIV